MKLFDIPIKVHWSTIILLLLLMPAFTLTGLAKGLILFIPIIIFLLGHEFAHALMARKFGYHTRHITLFALGGVASIQSANSLPPKEDLWITLAGPLFNIFFLVIFGLLYLWAVSVGSALAAPLIILMAVNFLLGVFNLIPGFPLDGGRITMALCHLKWGREKGHRIASYISMFSGALMVILGLLYGFWLFALFGVFICFMAYKH